RVDSNGDPISGIDCGATCTQTFTHGATVRLSRFASTGYDAGAWNGACAGQGDICTLTLTGPVTVGATFPIQTKTLTVTASADGTITGLGVNCSTADGADCSETYDYGTVVFLVASGVPGKTFTGWTGCDAASGATCTMTMDSAKTLSASYATVNHVLTAITMPNGAVKTVTALNTPTSGLNCGSGQTDCTESYAYNTSVKVQAFPETGYTFSSWGGACAGEATTLCTTSMTAAKSVWAYFTPTVYTFSAQTEPLNGTIFTVDSTTGERIYGIDCGTVGDDCTEEVLHGTTVALSAIGDSGYTFLSWGGDCAGQLSPTCVIVASEDVVVTANFTPVYELTVTTPENGSVAASGGSVGIACPSDCSQFFPKDTWVQLTATPSSGYAVGTWTGCFATTATTCSVQMTAAKTVSVTFTQLSWTLTISPRPSNGTVTLTAGALAGDNLTCGTGGVDCSVIVPSNTTVSLTATGATGYALSSWSPNCVVTSSSTCAVNVSTSTTTVAANFATARTLTISRPTGGTITTIKASGEVLGGIDCGANTTDCTEVYGNNVSVRLLATPLTGYGLGAWTGCNSTATTNSLNDTCLVTMSASKGASQPFPAARYSVAVQRSGGSGTVTSSPTGISCGTTCTGNFLYNSTVTLTATPASGNAFVKWSGGPCDGSTSNVCAFPVPIGGTSMTAEFVTVRTLTATKSTVGTLTSDVAGLNGQSINCGPAGSVCSTTFRNGQVVTLTATPPRGYSFTSWGTTPCSPAVGNVCTLTMGANVSAAATYTINKYALPVSKTSAAYGSVTSSPTGVSCGTTCISTSPLFNYATKVTLTATAATGYIFIGWTGAGATACTGLTTCVVTITDDSSLNAVTANFAVRVVLTAKKTNPSYGTLRSISTPNVATQVNCGTACTQQAVGFASGSTIVLTATPAAGYRFVNWTNCPQVNSDGTCTGANFTAARTVTANFAI
ncbi:MAG: InlB B-repeat-containing protein, partial [Ilumatobacteraceae bacterium]